MAKLTLENLDQLTKTVEVEVPVIKMPTWAKWTLGLSAFALVIVVIVLIFKSNKESDLLAQNKALSDRNNQLSTDNQDLKKKIPFSDIN